MGNVRILELTPSTIEDVVAPMMTYHLETHVRLEKEMTVLQARLVHGWRVNLGCSWGAVAARWCAFYPWADGGSILGNALCYRAAILLGQDPFEYPWN